MSRNEKQLKEIIKTLGGTYSENDNCTCELLGRVNEGLGGVVKPVPDKLLKGNNTSDPYVCFSEDKADIIITLDQMQRKFFYFKEVDINEDYDKIQYEINLNSKDVCGKNIYFYYDETDLTKLFEGKTTEMPTIDFTFIIKGEVTGPFRLYSEYYGGNSNNSKIRMGLVVQEGLMSPIQYEIGLDSEDNFKDVHISKGLKYMSSQGVNMKAYWEITRYYTIYGYGDPDC